MRAWFSLPNLFTLVRVLMAPIIVAAILKHRAFDALALLAVAASTDSIDGYLARHFHAATASGAFLDPVADKLLMGSVFLALAVAGSVPWWLVAVIFARDILILTASAVALRLTRLRAFPPSVWGKASTFFQIMTAIFSLGRDAFGNPALAATAAILVWPTAALTIWSGIHYGWAGIRRLRAV
ncbi:MAG TPA: CDP-alcohol phosphatidyltransferase family protein [Bryobacteraceae bacterium]|nr:CDP-alcohol phosphatidyltransferase family protein [Bryobacteraceae bacterium]